MCILAVLTLEESPRVGRAKVKFGVHCNKFTKTVLVESPKPNCACLHGQRHSDAVLLLILIYRLTRLSAELRTAMTKIR